MIMDGLVLFPEFTYALSKQSRAAAQGTKFFGRWPSPICQVFFALLDCFVDVLLVNFGSPSLGCTQNGLPGYNIPSEIQS